jgi:hypothetical protein
MVLVVAGCSSACTSDAPEQPLADRAPEAEPQPVAPAPEVVVEPPVPAPMPEPLPSFDPTTVTELTGRITVVHDPGWGVCGIMHSVGAIEVEVLDVGEPPPHMILYISCPSDLGRGGLLDVGQVVRVTLFARKQSWPKPRVERSNELPVRYVKRIERAKPSASSE